MIKKLKPGGFFIVEDLHTSFMDWAKDSEVTAFDFLKNLDKDLYDIEFVEFFHCLDEKYNVDCITSIIKKK